MAQTTPPVTKTVSHAPFPADNIQSVADTAPMELFLSGEQTIYQASELHQKWLAGLQKCGHLQLDLSCLSELDCAIAQLLVWVRSEAQRQGKTVVFANPSQALLDFVELMGLQNALPFAAEARHGS